MAGGLLALAAGLLHSMLRRAQESIQRLSARLKKSWLQKQSVDNGVEGETRTPGEHLRGDCQGALVRPAQVQKQGSTTSRAVACRDAPKLTCAVANIVSTVSRATVNEINRVFLPVLQVGSSSEPASASGSMLSQPAPHEPGVAVLYLARCVRVTYSSNGKLNYRQ